MTGRDGSKLRALELHTPLASDDHGNPDTKTDITEVQTLLGHNHVTQVYDKRRRSTRDSASHKVPL